MNNPVNRTDATGAWPEFIKNAAKWVTQNIAKPITETAKSIWSKRHENIVVGGLTGSASFGAGITGSAGLATDKDGNVAFVGTLGAGEGSPSASVSFFQTFTNAKNLESLKDLSLQTGGSVGIGLATVGAEYVCFSDSVTNELRSGVTISMGIGAPVPLEMHGFVGNNWVVNLFNIFSPFDNLYDKIMEW